MDSPIFNPDCKRRRISNNPEERETKCKYLMAAIDNFDTKRAHELVLEHGIKGVSSVYLSRLMKRAIETDNVILVKDLLDKDPRLKTESGKSLLWDAVLNNAMNVATMLVCNGASLTQRHNFSTFLHVLVSSQDPLKQELAVLMLEHGADPNVQDAVGNNALHCARSESPWLIRKLIQKGAELDTENKYDENVLALAACRPDARKLIDIILENVNDEIYKWNCIMDAIKTLMIRQDVNLNAIRVLCTSSGFDVKTNNIDGNSLVVRAIAAGAKEETIKLLIELGSDLTICNDQAAEFLYGHKNSKRVKFYIKRSVLGIYGSKTFYASPTMAQYRNLRGYYEKCLVETKYMESIMVNENLPMIKILTMDVKLLSWRMRNTNLIKNYEKNRNQTKVSCPIYYEDLKAAFTKAKQIKKDLDLKEIAFTEKLNNLLPLLVLDKIFFYVYMDYRINDYNEPHNEPCNEPTGKLMTYRRMRIIRPVEV